MNIQQNHGNDVLFSHRIWKPRNMSLIRKRMLKNKCARYSQFYCKEL